MCLRRRVSALACRQRTLYIMLYTPVPPERVPLREAVHWYLYFSFADSKEDRRLLREPKENKDEGLLLAEEGFRCWTCSTVFLAALVTEKCSKSEVSREGVEKSEGMLLMCEVSACIEVVWCGVVRCFDL
jgi:hypothetical protein